MAQAYNPYLNPGRYQPMYGRDPVVPPGYQQIYYGANGEVWSWDNDLERWTFGTSGRAMTQTQIDAGLAQGTIFLQNPGTAAAKNPPPWGGSTGFKNPYDPTWNPYADPNSPTGMMPGIVMGYPGINPSLWMSGGHTGEDKSFSRYLRQITGRSGDEGEGALDPARRQKMLQDFWKMPIQKKMRVFMALRSSGGLYRQIGAQEGQQIPTYGGGVISWRT